MGFVMLGVPSPARLRIDEDADVDGGTGFSGRCRDGIEERKMRCAEPFRWGILGGAGVGEEPLPERPDKPGHTGPCGGVVLWRWCVGMEFMTTGQRYNPLSFLATCA